MAKVSSTIVNKDLRKQVFGMLIDSGLSTAFDKINDRQYGIILTDLNGEPRYVRVGIIVTEQREDITAQELMQKEKDTYSEMREKKKKQAEDKAKVIAKKKGEEM